MKYNGRCISWPLECFGLLAPLSKFSPPDGGDAEWALENELEKLAPDSFTEDFKLLKKETNRF